MKTEDTQEMTHGRFGFVVDKKIPLWGLVSAAGGLALILVGMWFTMGQLQSEMVDLKIAVKVGNDQTGVLAREQAIQSFRMSNIESRLDYIEKETRRRGAPSKD